MLVRPAKGVVTGLGGEEGPSGLLFLVILDEGFCPRSGKEI